MRQDAIRDTFAELMNKVCHDVEIEPHLQSLQGESFDHRTTTTDDEARLDTKANGLRETGLREQMEFLLLKTPIYLSFQIHTN